MAARCQATPDHDLATPGLGAIKFGSPKAQGNQIGPPQGQTKATGFECLFKCFFKIFILLGEIYFKILNKSILDNSYFFVGNIALFTHYQVILKNFVSFWVKSTRYNHNFKYRIYNHTEFLSDIRYI